MPIVSNTSPLLNLSIINHLFLLKEQFPEIIIPDAVLAELKINENLPGSQYLREALAAHWIKVKSVENKPFVQLLRRELDQGESEAIALAIELNADWLLLDEQEGRKTARTFGLNITGVLGIILRAWHQGKLVSTREIMDLSLWDDQ
jgi:predicted nucleic acid-binding protein